jgi:hypothetical protein
MDSQNNTAIPNLQFVSLKFLRIGLGQITPFRIPYARIPAVFEARAKSSSDEVMYRNSKPTLYLLLEKNEEFARGGK